ncbi:MAG: HEPN domain-containing protein [Gemmataceae bacterium]
MYTIGVIVEQAMPAMGEGLAADFRRAANGRQSRARSERSERSKRAGRRPSRLLARSARCVRGSDQAAAAGCVRQFAPPFVTLGAQSRERALCSLAGAPRDILNRTMTRPKMSVRASVSPRRYHSPRIPLAAMRRFARRIADKFAPDKIILFGSYAYGTPHEESDEDLLVIMPCRHAIAQALRIDLAFDPPFSLDLIVRTPRQMDYGLRDPDDCDWFLREIVEKGKVLYEEPHRAVGPQGRGRHGGGGMAAFDEPPRNVVCFHCQQAAERFLKPLLQELGLQVPRTHNLTDLLELLVPHDSTLARQRRVLTSLKRYAVEYRYLGLQARTREMHAALRNAEAHSRDRSGLAELAAVMDDTATRPGGSTGVLIGLVVAARELRRRETEGNCPT